MSAVRVPHIVYTPSEYVVQTPSAATLSGNISSPGPATTDLIGHLDNLLARYLHTLDAYTSARTALSQQLANGFLSLAQANFAALPGQRFGRDYYDGRMKSRIRVKFVDEGGVTLSKVSVVRLKSTEDEKHNKSVAHPETVRKAKDKPVEMVEKHSDKDSIKNSATSNIMTTSKQSTAGSLSPTRPDYMTTTQTMSPSSEEAEPSTTAESSKLQCDPIRWFGLVVPTALRTAQNQFVTVTSDAIPMLVNLSMEIRLLEIEIGRTRKKILKAATAFKDVNASQQSVAINQQPQSTTTPY